jgi:hypothetical protein
MIPDNFRILIDKLKDKTLKKEAVWTKTSRDDEFKLDLGKGAILIDSFQDTGEKQVDISVLNENGDRIDYLAFSLRDRVDYDDLFELHAIAKRSYFKVDETFQDIFRQLDENKVIGRTDPF